MPRIEPRGRRYAGFQRIGVVKKGEAETFHITLKDMVGRLNAVKFNNKKAGRVMLCGCRTVRVENGDWECTMNFRRMRYHAWNKRLYERGHFSLLVGKLGSPK